MIGRTQKNIVVLGLSLSSSWGNGHATTYRALLKALAARGHRILFLERDRPWYAAHRDLATPNFCRLAFYSTTAELRRWAHEIRAADVVIVGSYVPEGVLVAQLVHEYAQGVTAFYDIDTPVTLTKLRNKDHEYLTPALIPQFDLYLSFTGGPVLSKLERRYGARCARPLYCSVDPQLYRPVKSPRRWSLGYLGTYSADRQAKMEKLLLEPARRLPHQRFVVAGAQYPADIAWPQNVEHIDHLPPGRHAWFYSSLGWALNLTRDDMVKLGHSPSVRIFEAAACGTPLISDPWPGLDEILRSGKEIAIADDSDGVVKLLAQPKEYRETIGWAGRQRVLASHTASHRAQELDQYLAELDGGPAERKRSGASLRRALGQSAGARV
jgi:spore maturation protein CgeB